MEGTKKFENWNWAPTQQGTYTNMYKFSLNIQPEELFYVKQKVTQHI